MLGESDSDNDVLDIIKDKLKSILNRSFREAYRKKIDTYPDRLSFSCPICGDSHSDIRKKRGNLYVNSLQYHCYNCGAHLGINAFLNRFGEELSTDDRIRVHEIQQSSKKITTRSATRQSSITYSLLDSVAVPKSIFFKNYNLVSPYKNEAAYAYLKSRKIDIRMWKYFAYNQQTQELYILNITPNDRIIGYQIRQLDPKSKKSRYLTKSLSRMYQDIFGKDLDTILLKVLDKMELGKEYIDEEDGIENISANIDKISGLFNIMNVDMSRTITIVEGPIDSLAIDNCIALQGATKMNDYFDDVRDVRYLFDNDMVGKQHSIEKLKKHKRVFLWDLYIKTAELKSKVKDVNDLQKIGAIKWDLFNSCFSDDELDVVLI